MPDSNNPAVDSGFGSASFGRLVTYAAQTSMVYTLGLAATRLGDFFLVPLYWSLLSPADYGIIAVAAIFIEFLSAVFGLGLPESITRFYYDWDEEQRRLHVGAIWALSWGSSIILGLLLMMLGGFIETIITQVSFRPYLQLAIWIGVMNSLFATPLFLFRTMEKAKLYIGASFLTLMLNTVFAILFVLQMREDGALAILMAQALSNTIMMLIYTAILLRFSIPNVRFKHWGPLLSFSLPLIPSKIIAAAAAVVDRFLLEKFISLNDLGLYQVTIRFARLLDVVMNGLRTAWIPLEMRLIVERPEDGREMVGRIAPFFIFVVLLVTVGLANILGYLVKFVDIEEYLPVIVLLPFAVLPRAIEGVATVLIQGYAIARKTHFAWLESTAVLFGAIIGNILLVPIFGVYGAFAASTLSVTLGGIIGYIFSARFFYIPFAWSAIIRLSGASALVILIGQLVRFESSFLGLGFTSGLLIAYAVWALYMPLDGHKWVASHKNEVNRLLRFWKQEG